MKDALSDPTMSKSEAKKAVAGYIREYEQYKKNVRTKSLTNWALEMGYAGRQKYRHPFGGGFDIHKAIGKFPKPKSGSTLLGHKYTGPYNPLGKQLKYDKNTGQILEIYDKTIGK